MPESVFERIVVPVASKSDARATCDAILPYIEPVDGHAVVVYVVEKAGGAPDKASVEQLEQEADRIFDIVVEALVDEDVSFETRILYDTDVADAILDTAAEVDASAIVFTPRGGSRLVNLITGDVARSLMNDTTRPVIALPNREGANG